MRLFKLILLFILLTNTSFSQQIYKKYTQLSIVNKTSSAVLILYKDSTFLMYSVFNDVDNQEVYIPYSYGKYEITSTETILLTSGINTKKDEVIRFIKTSYRTRSDHRMVNSFYEFVYETYITHVIIVDGTRADDPKKEIVYKVVR